MPEPINTAAIPGAELRPDMVDIAATEMAGIGEDVATQGGTVVTTWQRLAQHYEAPEADILFSVMDPVKTNAETFGVNVEKVSAALHTYAAEVEPIKAELARIKTDAENFVASTAGGIEKTSYSRAGAITTTVEWHEDQDSVDANNALIGRVNAQMVLLWAAERKCANAIYDIIGFPHVEAATDANPNGYGVNEIPEGAEMPWGAAVERTESCGEKAVGAVKGFVVDGIIIGGIGGTLVGLGALVVGRNPQTGEWFDSDTYAAAWSNLGMLGVGLLTASPGAALATRNLPGPVGDFFRRGHEALINTGKGIIAFDKWSEDPAAAAGEATFNIATIIIPAAAATAPVRTSASTAAAAIRTTARVVDLLDPASLAIRAGTTGARVVLPSIADITRGLDLPTLAPGTRIDLPDLPGGGIDIPMVPRSDVTVDVPTGRADIDVPVRNPDDAAADVPVRQPEPAGVGSIPGGGGIDAPTTGGGGHLGGGGGGTPTGGGPVPGGGGIDTSTGSGGYPGGSGVDAPTGGGAADGPTGGGGVDGPTGGSGADGPTGGGGGTPDGGTPWNPEMGDPMPSPADHGPDFVRDQTVRGDPIDPDYGQPRADHGSIADRYAAPDLDTVPAEVQDLVTDPSAPYGRDASGQPYTRAEWEERYTYPDGSPRYPGNDGAVPGRRIDFTSSAEFQAHYGDMLDRLGGRRGDFLSIVDTPFEQRALPPGNLSAPYLTVRLTDDLPPGTRIEVSEVAPAFGQPGGGIQVRILDADGNAMSVDAMSRQGVIEIVNDTSRSAGMPPPDGDTTPRYSEWSEGTAEPPTDRTVGGDEPTGGVAPTPDPTPNPGPDSGGSGGAATPDNADDVAAVARQEAIDGLRRTGEYSEPGSVPGWLAEVEHGVRLFGEEQLKWNTGENATLGRADSPVFMMPEVDAAVVRDGLDAAIHTGMAPSVLEAYRQGREIYGISVPLEGLTPRTPTAADAGGWPHFLEGGHTAVRVGDQWIVNPTREFVVPGGSPMPPGTIVFKLKQGGDWEPVAIFG